MIADTFADSLEKLSKQEQSSVKPTVFDLQVNPEQRELVMGYFARGRTNAEREADQSDWDISDPDKLVFRRKKRGPMGAL